MYPEEMLTVKENSVLYIQLQRPKTALKHASPITCWKIIESSIFNRYLTIFLDFISQALNLTQAWNFYLVLLGVPMVILFKISKMPCSSRVICLQLSRWHLFNEDPGHWMPACVIVYSSAPLWPVTHFPTQNPTRSFPLWMLLLWPGGDDEDRGFCWFSFRTRRQSF